MHSHQACLQQHGRKPEAAILELMARLFAESPPSASEAALLATCRLPQLGPHPVLGTMGSAALDDSNLTWVHTQCRGVIWHWAQNASVPYQRTCPARVLQGIST